MTDQFEHVMVLTSIIIGLGITHLLVGVGSIIERISGHGERLRLSLAHGAWLGFLFLWMVTFWWWQFRLLELVQAWTLGRYFFIIVYAVLLFLLAVILIPREWTRVGDLDEYFLAKRRWFYAIMLLANFADLLDSHLKGGWTYVLETGVLSLGLLAATVPACIIGFRSRNIRVHASMAVIFLVWQVIVGFDVFPQLSL